MTRRMQRKVYAVQIEIEEGELMLLPDPNSFATNDNPMYFDNLADAIAEADKWNTGTVIQCYKMER